MEGQDKKTNVNPKKEDHLMLVFNEANALILRDRDPPESPYRCLRRVLSASYDKVGVFTDTASELAHLLPPAAPSSRERGLGKFLSPVMDISTVDVIPITSDMSYFERLFTRGRPLWVMQLRYREENDLIRLVQFAYHKLS